MEGRYPGMELATATMLPAVLVASVNPEQAFRDSLAEFLVANGVAEERAGYGHATGEQVADVVVAFLSIFGTPVIRRQVPDGD